MPSLNTESGEIVYSDVNLDLGQASNYELLYNEDAIKRSILNIISTKKGSRPFRRDFGSNIMELLFDPLDNLTAQRLSRYLKRDILAHENRVVLEQVEVIPDFELDAYYVNIVGYMPRLNNRAFSFNFNLNRKVA